MIVVMSGTGLVAMEEREDGSTKASALTIAELEDNRDVSGMGFMPNNWYEEATKPLPVRQNQKASSPSLVTQALAASVNLNIGQETKKDDDEEQEGTREKTVEKQKSGSKSDVKSFAFWLAARPVVWGIRGTDKVTQYLDDKPIAKLATVCSLYAAGEVVNRNPQVIVSSAIMGCNTVTRLIVNPFNLAALSVLLVGGGLLPSAVSALFGSGNLLMTWRVSGQVEAVDKSVKQVEGKVDLVREKLRAFEESTKKAFKDQGMQLGQIQQRQEEELVVLRSMEADLKRLGCELSEKPTAEEIVILWQEKQAPIAAATQKNFEELQAKLDTMGEKLESISKIEWGSASIVGLQSLREMIDGRLHTIEQEVNNLKKRNEELEKQVMILNEQAKKTEQMLANMQNQLNRMEKQNEELRGDFGKAANRLNRTMQAAAERLISTARVGGQLTLTQGEQPRGQRHRSSSIVVVKCFEEGAEEEELYYENS